MQIFSYGNKRVKFSNRNVYVEPVENLHDLTMYEKQLDKNGVPWAVYVEVVRVSKDVHSTKFVLIAEEGT